LRTLLPCAVLLLLLYLRTTDLAEEFERSYLLLAELYVERGKFDLAQVTIMLQLRYSTLIHSTMCCSALVCMAVVPQILLVHKQQQLAH
jgi:hypothetical protein